MPTANANTGSGFTGVLNYVFRQGSAGLSDLQGSAKVLVMNNCYGSAKEIAFQMRQMTKHRERVSKPVLHLQINFHPDERLSTTAALSAVEGILSEIAILEDSHQYVIVQHTDKAHDHYHVVVNRVDMGNDLLNNERIIERLMVACDKIEQVQGLRPTPGRTVRYDASVVSGFRYATKEEKTAYRKDRGIRKQKVTIGAVGVALDQAEDLGLTKGKNANLLQAQREISSAIQRVLADASVSSPQIFQARLTQLNIEVKFMENKNGISGASFRKDNFSLKGSAMGFNWARIRTKLENNSLRGEKSLEVVERSKSPAMGGRLGAAAFEIDNESQSTINSALKNPIIPISDSVGNRPTVALESIENVVTKDGLSPGQGEGGSNLVRSDKQSLKVKLQALISQVLANQQIVTPKRLFVALKELGVKIELKQDRFLFAFKDSPQTVLSIKRSILQDYFSNRLQKAKVPALFRPLTSSEQNQLRFIAEFNKAYKQVLEAIEYQVKLMVPPNVPAIFKSFRFVPSQNGYEFSMHGWSRKLSDAPLARVLDNVNLYAKEFEYSRTEYRNLMASVPEKVPLLLGRAQAIQKNEDLELRQRQAIKPTWKPPFDRNSLDIVLSSSFAKEQSDFDLAQQNRWSTLNILEKQMISQFADLLGLLFSLSGNNGIANPGKVAKLEAKKKKGFGY